MRTLGFIFMLAVLAVACQAGEPGSENRPAMGTITIPAPKAEAPQYVVVEQAPAQVVVVKPSFLSRLLNIPIDCTYWILGEVVVPVKNVVVAPADQFISKSWQITDDAVPE